MHGACPPVRAALQTDAWSSPSSHFAKPSVLWSERARAPPVGNSSRLTCSLHQRKVRRSHVVRVAAAAPTATSSETVRLGTRRPKRDDACAQCADECKGARARGETGLIQDQSGGLTSPVSETSQLCLVSILGFILYCITYVPDERTSLQFIVKLLYFVLCLIGLVISVLVMAFAGYHYSQTSSFNCDQVEEDCVCRLDRDDPIARTFTYKGVSDCEVITGTLTLYFLLQIVLNLAQAIVCAVGAFIMWKDRYQVFFAGLQIGSPSTQHWQKV